MNYGLSIIIVSYKSKEHLKMLLPSIFASTNINFTSHPDPLPQGEREYRGEVIVIDNDSRDGTVEWIREWQKTCIVHDRELYMSVIASVNNGFATGNNLGIKQAQGRYILLLNPDTQLQPDSLKVMLNFMETHPQVGISSCKIIKADGTLDLACRRRFPNPWNSFRRLFLKDNRNYNYSDIDENQEMEVESVVGAFLLIRRSVIDKIGFLDEKFFLYGEDLDWCWRCREAGYKVWYYPKTFITHYKGSSSKKAPFKSLKAFHDAMWIFYKKYYWQKYFILFHWLIWIGIYSRLVFLAIINFFKRERVISK